MKKVIKISLVAAIAIEGLNKKGYDYKGDSIAYKLRGRG